MEYYLKDIGIYDMTSDKWTYFVQGDDRIARVFPQNYQSPGQNAANTDLKVSQGMANFYEYDHLGNTRIVYSVRDIHNGTTNFDVHFAADYYPYGKTLRYFETAAFEEKFLTTQHERDRETGFDYRGARYYDADLGRFLSLDEKAADYPSLSAYSYVAGNPIIFIDPDGKDIVYYDNNGNETKRVESTTKFETYVDLEGNGNYSSAPMPNIIEGYENAKYQQFDHIISAQTFIFNNMSPAEMPTTGNGLYLDGQQPAALSPTLVKAIALKETKLGNFNGANGQNGSSDIMQVNVSITNSKGEVIDSDWSPYKSTLGLTENGSATPQQSIHAGIRMLYSKGLVVTNVVYENGKLSENSTVNWRGGNTNSWWNAVKNYNGSSKKEQYVKDVYEYWNNSSFSKDSKYYVPQ